MGTTNRCRFKEIFSGSPEDLDKGAFMRWMRELRERRMIDNIELQVLYDAQVQVLLPGERTGYRPQVVKWVQAVGMVIDSACHIASSTRDVADTPIWAMLVALSEGRFKREAWDGCYNDRRRLVAAARAIRQFLVNEETGSYQESAQC